MYLEETLRIFLFSEKFDKKTIITDVTKGHIRKNTKETRIGFSQKQFIEFAFSHWHGDFRLTYTEFVSQNVLSCFLDIRGGAPKKPA